MPLNKALLDIRNSVTALSAFIPHDSVPGLDGFRNVVDKKLLACTDPDYPLVVSIAGGGSTGKSTIFNAIAGGYVSATKARAGLTRRTLAAIHPQVLVREGFLESLFSTFGEVPERLESSAELTEPGPPRYVECESIPPNIVLLDTPDFDTGDSERLFNRDVAKPILEASDVLLYVFTGTTYNNRANTQFVGSVLRELGCRKVALLYRCYSNLPDEEVREHADVVLRGIYGGDGAKWSLGVFRVDEDNRVVEGRKHAEIRPLGGGRPLMQALSGLSPADVRGEFLREALSGVGRVGDAVYSAAEAERLRLSLYSAAVGVATSWATTEAVRSFPQTALLSRLSERWIDAKPLWIRTPIKFGNWVGRKMGALGGGDTRAERSLDEAGLNFRKDLAEAANKLRNQLVAEGFAVKTRTGDPHGAEAAREVKELQILEGVDGGEFAVEPTQGGVNLRVARPDSLEAELARRPPVSWEKCIGGIAADAGPVMEVSGEFDARLGEIVLRLRQEMGARDKVLESLTAILPSFAGAGAVIWVLGTGAAGAAAGRVAAHIGGLFGVSDLWALLTVPAMAGLSETHRKTFEAIIEPIMGAWLEEKTGRVRAILEQFVARPVLDAANEASRGIVGPLADLSRALQALSAAQGNQAEDA